MIGVSIPGYGSFELRHVVTDYNGTLAVDGVLIDGVAAALRSLAERVEIHVITADTFGLAQAQLAGLPVTLTITPPENQAEAKLDYVRGLGASGVVAIGNGRNDRKMLESAAIGIALVQKEGASAETLRSADVVSAGILDALDLLRHTDRLKATLRS
ncbi:HAD family hydrolase [Pseudothauera rhizosphaerae]|uniref:ATPase P n=1 Tax=Pseudothauera rhizosphaerae TaxID=2565932 RepID=A0A4S4ASK0_9RHOO|nr:HAD family hydrolase [Pseudothauera rhizosphaerae]THF62708.1 ATPase P [Pseudothauera rhizosphaerae]